MSIMLVVFRSILNIALFGEEEGKWSAMEMTMTIWIDVLVSFFFLCLCSHLQPSSSLILKTRNKNREQSNWCGRKK